MHLLMVWRHDLCHTQSMFFYNGLQLFEGWVVHVRLGLFKFLKKRVHFDRAPVLFFWVSRWSMGYALTWRMLKP